MLQPVNLRDYVLSRPVAENRRLVGHITCRQLPSAVRTFGTSPNYR